MSLGFVPLQRQNHNSTVMEKARVSDLVENIDGGHLRAQVHIRHEQVESESLPLQHWDTLLQGHLHMPKRDALSAVFALPSLVLRPVEHFCWVHRNHRPSSMLHEPLAPSSRGTSCIESHDARRERLIPANKHLLELEEGARDWRQLRYLNLVHCSCLLGNSCIELVARQLHDGCDEVVVLRRACHTPPLQELYAELCGDGRG
mmetsp:Transcript_13938/g.48140  ORF Transcript_13938/g.48140 Transcript_13938/m.48140 type:complete len:203 (+) Transcript_13938:397-1005(+)